jgi:hypothetical protein
MQVSVDEAIEWAERVREISESQGQSCHEYKFAADAILALRDEVVYVRQELLGFMSSLESNAGK